MLTRRCLVAIAASVAFGDGDGKGISRIWPEVLPASTSKLAKRNLDAKRTLV